MKAPDKELESQLWHACAGGMVQMPPVNSVVFYFPQGHIEHAQGNVDLGVCPRFPPLIPCRVTAIKFMADPETDEVFVKIRLSAVKQGEPESGEEDRGVCVNGMDVADKLASFAKTLTQSDANNGGGFSVPRYCAETIFPRLDYSEDPPVQTVLAKDVHGEQWKFRHIYRGTPRRHLLTTGWSTFVNQKRLVAGDSIVFLRTENGELCVGIRRAKRGIGDGVETPSGWNPPNGNAVGPYGSYPVYMREEESKLMRSNGSFGNAHSGGGMRGRARVRPESVVEAITLAASGQPFEVVYYPRASTPEFCVKASAVRAAMRIQWQAGMRFKMAFETEDSSRISWFMGTISGVQVADPIRWPSSYWRLLQVTWDEPDLLQNVKRVSPWLVELVSNIPIHLSPFSPPRKKLRVPQHPEFPLDSQYHSPVFFGNPLGHGSSPLCCLPNGNTPAGIQGARHAQIDLSLSDLHLNKLQSSLFASFHRHEHVTPNPRIGNGVAVVNPSVHDNLSCLLTMGNSSHHVKKLCETNTSPFLLFGQPILTEKQMSMSSSGDTVNGLSNGNMEKTTNVSDSLVNPLNPSPWNVSNGHLQPKEYQFGELGLEIGHCKVFIESEDVGRTLDLSVLSSYDELCRRLADMFGLDKSTIMGQVRYRDSAGALKQAGDEPFGDFTKTARRLTILMDSCSENTAR